MIKIDIDISGNKYLTDICKRWDRHILHRPINNKAYAYLFSPGPSLGLEGLDYRGVLIIFKS